MKCPVCADAQLVLAERSGIEIDYCPNCRGVWLDRGELDKIIERSVAAPVRQQPNTHGHRQDFVDSDFDHQGRRRKKSWLRDIFD